ncbi:coiled-coil domain-containing protein 186 [Xylocopa sonorina]|uniref:coiled-coil domain-containing protein 186 n=1 Tax=Xylocopa sonorina TaxID=1818115 RepID=UPI00403AC4A2
MDFLASEMNEENSKLTLTDRNGLEYVEQTDSTSVPDVSLIEAKDPLIQEYTNVYEEAMQIQEEFVQDNSAQIETESVLLKNNDKEGYYGSIEANSINTSMKGSTSLSNFSEEYIKYQEYVHTGLPREKCLQKSSSYNDIRLPSTMLSDTISYTSSDILSNCSIESAALDKYKELNTACNDEEETLFSSKLYTKTSEAKSGEEIVNTEKHNNSEIKNNFDVHSDVDEKLMRNQMSTLKSLVKCEKDDSKEQQPCEVIKSIKSQSNVISRPTLIDDSRLVKISLPTNPINIMQSNAQFLNKSRNFLNFITEKSTNIMEKALLPQHLTMRYNSVMKSIDNTYNERRYIDESCNAETSLTTPVFSSGKNTINMKSEENECTKNDENRNTMTTSSETIYANTEQNNKYTLTNDHILHKSSDNDNIESIDLKQSESYSVSNDTKEKIDHVHSIQTNENYDIDSMVLNFEGDTFHDSVTNGIYQKEGENIDVEESKQSLLQHPAYLALLKHYTDLKSKHIHLQERVGHLEEQNRTLEAGCKREDFSVSIEALEKTINRLTSELHTSLEAQETFKKEYNAANKERESMVMKYVVSEKQLIDTQRARESAERKVKEMTAQQEALQSKLREMQGERSRICNILSGKHREVTDLHKEVERLREDVKMRDIKLQWTQNKLKLEMDLQKETQQKLDKVTIRVNEMKEECDQVRKETQETMRKFQQSEENKAVTLDQQLKEQQARLILERHVTEDKEMLRLQLQKEVDTLKHRQQVLIEENNTLSLKIQDVEKNRLNYESKLNNLKIIADQRQKEIVELLSKVSELETLKVQLQHKDQYLASTETEIQHLRWTNEELQADMSACRQKEAEMLDFTQKLTDKNVRLQSEFTAIEAKVKQLEKENGPLHERISELMKKVKALEESLAQERKSRTEECETLAKHLAEQTQIAQNLAQQLEDSQGENAVLKRKQQISMKEMTRELQQCRKKLEMFEAASPYNSLGVTSRTGSNISLNTGDILNGALSDNSVNGDQNIQPTEPSKQVLIDRIIKLQESNARKAEKLDFFEEHTRILVEELQKKKRIIQNYILHENIGAMGGNERDKYKVELARHGGIMASVYNQRVSDDNMTLELSLEINQKLQAVLEDALFKNITLKDNIDTLGEEIARLTMQNQQRQNTH